MLRTDLPRKIRRNYAVEVDGDRITKIVEKPRIPPNDILGSGSYGLAPRLFTLLEDAFERAETPPDWMAFLAELVARGESVRAIDVGGEYANVNDRDQLNYANLLVRHQEFASKRVSVALVAEPADRIADVLRRFARAAEVDEVIVVARDPSELEAEFGGDSKVRIVECLEGELSFGDMTRRALDAASGDILVLTQGDDCFQPDDLGKLLTYSRDADLVVGTRTSREMIERGSDMRGVVRAAHIALAKLMEVLWWGSTPRLTDVGCVFRALWKDTWQIIRPRIVTHGQEIYPEMVLEVLQARRRVIEIPVNYYNRDPLHEAVRSPYQTSGTFFRILWLLIVRSLRRFRLR